MKSESPMKFAMLNIIVSSYLAVNAMVFRRISFILAYALVQSEIRVTV